MPSFAEVLASRDFVFTLELDPPREPDLAPFRELAAALAGRVDAIMLTDNPGARVHLPPLVAAQALGGDFPAPLIVNLACRDHNRLALAALVRGALALGQGCLFVVSGGAVALGEDPAAKPVHDLDSVQALELAAGLAGDRPLCLGAAAAPEAQPRGPQLLKLRKKIRAGAGFLVTQPLAAATAGGELLAELGPGAPPVLGGVRPGPEGGVAEAAQLVARLRQDGLRGAHLSWPGEPARLAELLAACGR